MRAADTRPASHPASRLSVSIPDSHLYCLSFSALIGFLVLTHTPGPVFDPGDGFSRSLGLQLPSLSGAVEGGGGRAGVSHPHVLVSLWVEGTLPRARRCSWQGRMGVGTAGFYHGKWIFSLGLHFPFGTGACGGCGPLS